MEKKRVEEGTGETGVRLPTEEQKRKRRAYKRKIEGKRGGPAKGMRRLKSKNTRG